MAHTAKSTILAVDDNRGVLDLLKRVLETGGYEVLTAVDGKQALGVFQDNQHSISMVLTDVDMPVMNGLELADCVLELNENIPVLFLSGNTHDANRGYGCLGKPFKMHELLDRVAAVLS